MERIPVVIMGAAGRDFHNFNVAFRDDPRHEVVAFTAAQIPHIEGRRYPRELSGPLYPDGIPILPESELADLVESRGVRRVVFSYSDMPHAEVMHRASIATAHGADFLLLGTRATMLRSRRKVVSVCAVRTGSGKSPVARKIAGLLRAEGMRVAVVRHPMPYGDLASQAVQRFATVEDMRRAECTIEEMEEYEPHIEHGAIVWAGVDYARILERAEEEADVLVWDGGNNDTPFIESDCEIVVLDPHRAGHEMSYWPGEVNFRRADVFVLNKIDTAEPSRVAAVRASIRAVNPGARVVDAAMPVSVDEPAQIRGKRVLVVEDGPTITHGDMGFGAGLLAATKFGARAVVDPRPFAVGSIAEAYAEFRHIGPVLPALGYSPAQVGELEETLRRADADTVLIGTPVDLRRILQFQKPAVRVRYEISELGRPDLADVVQELLKRGKKHA